MQSKLLAISNLLSSLTCDVWHYSAPDKSEAPYVVWAEDDRADLEAGNLHAEKAWIGTIHLFTHTEFDTLNDSIEEILDSNFTSWYLDLTEYNEEADLIHTSWVFTYA